MEETARTIYGRRTWRIGQQIAGGGIGTIHEAWLDGHDERDAYVAKLVPVEPGADREFLLAEVAGARNVVPVVDSGATDEHYVLIMPRATRSLDDLLTEKGQLDVAYAIRVAVDVASALTDIGGRVVHRDIKPGNILQIDETWCLTDFGISRYAEASTSPATRKLWMSRPYASPEQWRHEHATSAADVYALGIVLFEMLAGHVPFPGPRPEDFQAQHLFADPPNIPSIRTDLQTLIVECLYKAPQARPTAQEVLDRLERLDKPPPVPLHPLRDESLRLALARAAEAQHAALRITDQRRRSELVDVARRGLKCLGTALSSAILTGAPNANRRQIGRSWRFVLGNAELSQSDLIQTEAEPWDGEPPPAFDVIASAEIRLTNTDKSMSHSLWYCDFPNSGRYGWTEFAFTTLVLLSNERPHALLPSPEAARAFADCIDYTVVESWPGVEHAIEDYVERWTMLLAARSAAPSPPRLT